MSTFSNANAKKSASISEHFPFPDSIRQAQEKALVAIERARAYSGEGERLFRRESERGSGVKVNSIGAKRRWRDDCAGSVRNRQ